MVGMNTPGSHLEGRPESFVSLADCTFVVQGTELWKQVCNLRIMPVCHVHFNLQALMLSLCMSASTKRPSGRLSCRQAALLLLALRFSRCTRLSLQSSSH